MQSPSVQRALPDKSIEPTDRNQRVKDARGEAAKEIDAYKTKQEAEFDNFDKEVRSRFPSKDVFQDMHINGGHSQHSGDNDTMQASLDKSTDSQLDKIRTMFGDNRQAVVDKLLDRVIEVYFRSRSWASRLHTLRVEILT